MPPPGLRTFQGAEYRRFHPPSKRRQAPDAERDGGRLRKLRFRVDPLEFIDSRIFQFDFDVMISDRDRDWSADGLTFTLLGGGDPVRVGLPGGGMGYAGLTPA